MACDDEQEFTSYAAHAYIALSSGAGDSSDPADAESFYCSTGCCMMGCTCCPLQMFLLYVPTLKNVHITEVPMPSDLLAGHRLLLFRPPMT